MRVQGSGGPGSEGPGVWGSVHPGVREITLSLSWLVSCLANKLIAIYTPVYA